MGALREKMIEYLAGLCRPPGPHCAGKHGSKKCTKAVGVGQELDLSDEE